MHFVLAAAKPGGEHNAGSEATEVGASRATGVNTENLWLPVAAGKQYELHVERSSGQAAWDYGLAWRMDANPEDDSDGDGMPDSWETRYGLDPADAADYPITVSVPAIRVTGAIMLLAALAAIGTHCLSKRSSPAMLPKS